MKYSDTIAVNPCTKSRGELNYPFSLQTREDGSYSNMPRHTEKQRVPFLLRLFMYLVNGQE